MITIEMKNSAGYIVDSVTVEDESFAKVAFEVFRAYINSEECNHDQIDRTTEGSL